MKTTYQYSDFAEIFLNDTGITQLMDDLGVASNSNDEIYMLGGGNPAQIEPAQTLFREAMTKIMANPKQFEKITSSYDGPQGDHMFINDLTMYLNKHYNWNISSENIALTNGSQASFFALFNLFSGQSDGGKSKRQILLPLTPEYIGYKDVGLEKDMFISHIPIIDNLDNGFFKYRVDFNRLKDFSNIGAICTSRPTNPTGNVLTNSEITQLSKLAKQHNIPLIIDGAYGTPFPSIIFKEVTPIWDENTILCLSLSKLGLPGVRTGIVIATKEVIKLLSRMNAIYNLAVGSIGPAIISQLIKDDLFRSLSHDIIKPYYKNKLNQTLSYFEKYMQDLPIKIHQPEGAIFLWLWMENLPISSAELYQILKSKGVYVIAGEHFFPGLNRPDWKHQYECIRVSYTGDEKSVEAGFRIIAQTLKSIYKR